MAGFRVPEQQLPDEWRDYRIVCLTGWDEEQIGAQRTQWLDWLLQFDALVNPGDGNPR